MEAFLFAKNVVLNTFGLYFGDRSMTFELFLKTIFEKIEY